MLRSADDLIDRLKQFSIHSHNTVVSFNVPVVSLFTNAPLAKTIELIIGRLYSEGNPNSMPLRKLMFITIQGLFMYKNKLK